MVVLRLEKVYMYSWNLHIIKGTLQLDVRADAHVVEHPAEFCSLVIRRVRFGRYARVTQAVELFCLVTHPLAGHFGIEIRFRARVHATRLW